MDAARLVRRACPEATLEQVADFVQAWEVLPYEQDGEVAGVAVMRGTEFHCQAFEGLRMNRAVMREFVRPLLARHGFLTTRVAVDDEANHRFNRLFGFEKTWSDGVFDYFVLTRLPFERRGTCQL